MNNPEFRRNLWLEFSPRRLVLMVAVLGIIGALTAYLSQDQDPGELTRNLGLVFGVLGAFLVGGWGSFAVVHSIGSEISERTWDQQRLSALSPWQMAWGKLLGASMYPWSGGLICAAVVLAAGLAGSNPPRAVLMLVAAIIGLLALHCWLMASRLHTMDANAPNPPSSTVQRLFGLFVLLQVVPGFAVLGLMRREEAGSTGNWWGLQLGWSSMSLLMASLALALGLLALWRTMSAQLMVRTTPWAWLLGCVMVGLVVAGFMDGPETHFVWPGIIAAVALLASYFAVFTEKNNAMVWRAVAYHAKHGQWQRLLQALPLWPVSWLLAMVCTGMYASLFSVRGNNGATDLYHVLPAVLTMSALHTLRDMGIYLFFAWRNTTRKPAGMALLSYAMLSYVLPMFAGFGSSQLAQLFEPLYGINYHNLMRPNAVFSPMAWLAMLVHVAVVALLLAWRWKTSVRLNVQDSGRD